MALSDHTDSMSTVNERADVIGTFTPEIMRMKATRQNIFMPDILFITFFFFKIISAKKLPSYYSEVNPVMVNG